MEIGDRIKFVRKAFKLTQQEFGARIGLKRNTIGNYEINAITPSDRTIADICRVFNVNEQWLRDGIGDVFRQDSATALDDFLRAHGATDFELDIIKTYFEIPPETRKGIIEHFRTNMADRMPQPAPAQTPTPPQDQLDIASELAELRRQNEELRGRVRLLEEEEAIETSAPLSSDLVLKSEK